MEDVRIKQFAQIQLEALIVLVNLVIQVMVKIAQVLFYLFIYLFIYFSFDSLMFMKFLIIINF